jgi:autotransporter-associated beta strand protein
LSGANTYTGDTTINAGTVKVGDNTSTGTLGAGKVINNGTLSFGRTNAIAVSNEISGSGRVTQAGSGTLTLSGTNTYTGGTTLTAGTLNLGSAAAIGSSGSISFGGGTLQHSASNTTDYSSRFSTAASQAYKIDTNGQSITWASALTSAGGSLNKLGSGTLLLSGANTYSGVTTISAGTLQVGAGSTSGSLVGNVVNNATLAFDRSDALTYAGVISGSGAVTKAGSGNLLLSGANSYSGGTTVSAGTLAAGSGTALGTGAVTLSSSAVLDLTHNGTVALGSTLSMAVGSAITNSANTSSLSVAGASTLAGTVHTAGSQTYTGAVTLASATTLNTSNSPVAFNATVNSTPGNTFDLTVNNGTGSTSLGGAVGAVHSLGNLSLNGTGAVSLGANITSLGNQTYAGPVSAAAGITLTANDGIGPTGIITNGNNNNSHYAFGVPDVSNLGETNYYVVASGSSTADITPSTNTHVGIMFYNNTGTLNGAGSNASWCCYNYPVMANAGKSSFPSSISVVTRGDGLASRVPTALSVYGSNVPFSSSYTYTPQGNPSSVSNVAIQGVDYQQSNFSLIGSGSLTFAGGGVSSPTLSNAISLSNASAYQYFQIVFSSTGGTSNSLSPNLTGPLALNAINLYGRSVANSITFKQSVTANGALNLAAGRVTAAGLSAGGAVAVNSRNDSIITGSISDNGSNAASLVKTGAGALTLSGANVFTGGTTITSGTVKAGSASALGAGAVSIGAAGVLDLTHSGTVALGSTLSMAAGSAITNSANTSSLSVAGASTLAGTINTAGSQTYTGAVTLAADTTVASTAAGALTFAGPVNGGFALTVNSQGDVAFNAEVGGTNPLASLITDAGGRTLLGANVTTVGSQTYQDDVLATSAITLKSTGSLKAKSIQAAGALTLHLGGSGMVQGVVSDGASALSLIKAGPGELSLLGANTYTGGTALNEGTLGLYTNSALGTGALTVGTATLKVGRAVTQLDNALVLNGSASVVFDRDVDYLVVGGGGAGASGGGGAGGFLEGKTALTGESYAVSVGVGGQAAGSSGTASTAFGQTASGGGGGAGGGGAGQSGASGGGGGYDAPSATVATGMAGQGFSGGVSNRSSYGAGGGGGGAGGAGGNASTALDGFGRGGDGGLGKTSDITGETKFYAGGGGGGANTAQAGTPGGLAGSGVGGAGATGDAMPGQNAVAHTGSGGGGAEPQGSPAGTGAAGLVVARYKGSAAGAGGSVATGTGTAEGYTVHTFTSAGTLALNPASLTLTGTLSGAGALQVNAGGGVLEPQRGQQLQRRHHGAGGHLGGRRQQRQPHRLWQRRCDCGRGRCVAHQPQRPEQHLGAGGRHLVGHPCLGRGLARRHQRDRAFGGGHQLQHGLARHGQRRWQPEQDGRGPAHAGGQQHLQRRHHGASGHALWRRGQRKPHRLWQRRHHCQCRGHLVDRPWQPGQRLGARWRHLARHQRLWGKLERHCDLGCSVHRASGLRHDDLAAPSVALAVCAKRAAAA